MKNHDVVCLTPSEGQVLAFTQRESGPIDLGHDLKLQLDAFEVKLNITGSLIFRAWPSKVTVIGGRSNRSSMYQKLSQRDATKIQTIIYRNILKVEKYPMIRLDAQLPYGWDQSREEPQKIQALLTMMDKTNSITLYYTISNDQLMGWVELAPLQWGIQPYRALLGVLKLKNWVRLEWSFDLPRGVSPLES